MLAKTIKTALIAIATASLAGVISYYGYYAIKYPAVSDAPDIKINATPELIEQGRYLANHVYVCFECHTPRNWDYFSGPPIKEKHGMGGEQMTAHAKYGDFFTSNITPAALSDWTDGELMRAITVGVRKNDAPLFVGMPSMKYSDMPTEDLHAIVAYLRTIKPIEIQVPESSPKWDFWIKMRTWQKDSSPKEKPAKSDTMAYALYLMEAASCTGCHTNADENQQFNPDKGLSGGFPFTNYKRTSKVRSANITPDSATGIGRWTKEMFIQRFHFYATEEGQTIPAPVEKLQSPMPWAFYSGMNDEDLGYIYTYLMAQPAVNNTVKPFTP